MMPNTERWTQWLVMLRQSDAVIVNLATMAALAVLVWEMLRRVREPWRDWLRTACLLATLIIFIYLMGGAFDTTAFTLTTFGVMFVLGGRLAVMARRPQPKEITHGNADDEQ